jgi:hypothetical protein
VGAPACWAAILSRKLSVRKKKSSLLSPPGIRLCGVPRFRICRSTVRGCDMLDERAGGLGLMGTFLLCCSGQAGSVGRLELHGHRTPAARLASAGQLLNAGGPLVLQDCVLVSCFRMCTARWEGRQLCARTSTHTEAVCFPAGVESPRDIP